MDPHSRTRLPLSLSVCLILFSVFTVEGVVTLALTFAPESPPPSAVFVTTRVSQSLSTPQGDTAIVADGKGHVVVAWMNGSPAKQAKLSLLFAYSINDGK